MNKFYLYPGDIFVSKEPHVIDTILGSCIAVAIWDPVLKFGSINHFMLPNWDGKGSPSFKYGDIAISELIKRMLVMGSLRKNLKAKVFGGSSTGAGEGIFHIGRRNTNLAIEILNKEEIPIIGHSVGGIRGRKVVFYSATGEVMIKFIKSDANRAKELFH